MHIRKLSRGMPAYAAGSTTTTTQTTASAISTWLNITSMFLQSLLQVFQLLGNVSSFVKSLP